MAKKAEKAEKSSKAITVHQRGMPSLTTAFDKFDRFFDRAVSVEGDTLVIHGCRTLRLPEGVSAGQIEASYKDGVLEVTLPSGKPAKTEAKKVKVS